MATPPSEQRRLRELRKYYTRSSDDISLRGTDDDATDSILAPSTTPISSPNKILTALMQLIACRLGMQRAMVSVVDQNEQYFLAESTRTLNLADSSQHEEIADGLWMGCGGTKRTEALCANTIDVPLRSEGFAYFSVSDLSKDDRFSSLPYVAGSPHFRFYAGTPLLTRDNVPIGSVFVIDDRPRGPPTKFEIEFLGVMAQNVMEYLEMRRESELRKRSEIMSKGLAAFVAGRSGLQALDTHGVKDAKVGPSLQAKSGADPEHHSETISEPTHTNNHSTTSVRNIESKEQGKVDFLPLKSSSENDDAFLQTRAAENLLEEMPTKEGILTRASNILRDSLDVEYTVLLDLEPLDSISVEESGAEDVTSDDIIESQGEDARRVNHGNEGKDNDNQSRIPPANTRPILSSVSSRKASNGENRRATPAKILSFSTSSSFSHNNQEMDPSIGFRAPDYKSLTRLVKRYPIGKLWSFCDTGPKSSQEDLPNALTSSQTLFHALSNLSTEAKESSFLMDCFPGVRKLLMTPLWDVEKSVHVAVCFAVSFEPIPIFTEEVETGFMRAFMNSVSISYSRANIAAANRQKGDFISSISHELRSPLHGIIASTELLNETLLDGRQNEYCNTIATCGQSLLETITDILEYTKINTLRKDARESKEVIPKHLTDSNLLPISNTLSPPSKQNLACSIIDVSKVCSDAATVVSTAYKYHASSSDQPLYRVFIPPESATESNESHSSNVPEIVVILNITPGDWKFVAHRASIQRIIMNLVGNSLKYTHSGFVKIDLSLDDPHRNEDAHPKAEPATSIVKLVVSDSGRGIGSEFLKTKLFSAFSQESTLAPGTGLGLHIVKSLVQLQQGTIEIKSEVHRGTSVIVRLPVQRPSASLTHPTSEDVQVRNRDDKKISTARQAVQNKKFACQGFRGTTGKLVSDSLRNYLVGWFGMRSISEEEVEVIITDEEGLNECLSSISRLLHRPKLIVFCDQSRQQLILQAYHEFETKFEFLTSPFGPYKLSKVLLACFKHVQLQNGFHTSDSSGTESSLEEVQDTDSILTNGLLPPKSQNIVQQASQPTIIPESLPIRTISPSKPLHTQTQPRILCVDDNAINLRLLKTYMDKLGFKDVTIAENGKVAFEVFRRRVEGFDLIFMDLSMPICDGFQCSSLIRTLEKMQLKVTPPDTPPPKPALIVALTGLASERDQDAATAVGMDHFLTKPLKLSRLKELMVEWGVMGR